MISIPTNVHFYNRDDLGHHPWPPTIDGDYARRYLSPFLQDGPQKFIANVQTDMAIVRVGNVILPVTLGDFRPGNSYVCSPYNQYIDYGKEELSKLGSRAGEAAIRALLRPLGALFRRCQLDRVVMVNNWLLSTNLYPAIEFDQLAAAHAFLIQRFPSHTILFRSVDSLGNSALCAYLSHLGYQMVFSRQVYYMDVRNPKVTGKKQFKIDLSKHRKTPYRLGDGAMLSASDVDRIRALYNDLYLHKYSFHNPQFTTAFFRLALDEQLLEIRTLRHQERIDAVLGYFWRTNASGAPVMTQPLFGYDTSLPQSMGLYRLLSTQTALEGIAHQRIVHCSAGVGEFKRLRGAVPALEYNAVYHAHLPYTRRLPWRILKILLDWIGIPVVQKYGF
jgi:hypothetical protein